MSGVFRYTRVRLSGACVLGLLLLAGCGQRGPLMLPEPQPAASVPADPSATGDAATDDEEEDGGR